MTGDTAAPVDCTGLDWQTVGEPFIDQWCVRCHSSTAFNRGGAPLGVDFDTYAGVIEWIDRVRVRAVVIGNMPPDGTPPAADVRTFGDWITCGAIRAISD